MGPCLDRLSSLVEQTGIRSQTNYLYFSQGEYHAESLENVYVLQKGTKLKCPGRSVLSSEAQQSKE